MTLPIQPIISAASRPTSSGFVSRSMQGLLSGPHDTPQAPLPQSPIQFGQQSPVRRSRFKKQSDWPPLLGLDPAYFRWFSRWFEGKNPDKKLSFITKLYQQQRWVFQKMPSSLERRGRYWVANLLHAGLNAIDKQGLNASDRLASQLLQRRIDRDLWAYNMTKKHTPNKTIFEEKLYYDHHFDVTIQDLQLLADHRQMRIKKQLISTGHLIEPNSNWRFIYAKMLKQPQFYRRVDLVEGYRNYVDEVTQFVREHQLFPEPPNLKDRIYLSMNQRLFKNKERVVPDVRQDKPVLLINGETNPVYFSAPEVMANVINVLYPGTVYFQTENQKPLPKPDTTLERSKGLLKQPSTLTQAGWSSYVMELMLEEGLLDKDPKAKMSVLRKRFKTAFMSDELIDYVDGSSTEKQVTANIKKYLGSRSSSARRSIQKMLTEPETYLYRTLGEEMILTLRDKVMAKEGDAFTLKSFHERFLNAGQLPIPVIAKTVFGVPLTKEDVLSRYSEPIKPIEEDFDSIPDYRV